jgi:hypothetical protein
MDSDDSVIYLRALPYSQWPGRASTTQTTAAAMRQHTTKQKQQNAIS